MLTKTLQSSPVTSLVVPVIRSGFHNTLSDRRSFKDWLHRSGLHTEWFCLHLNQCNLQSVRFACLFWKLRRAHLFQLHWKHWVRNSIYTERGYSQHTRITRIILLPCEIGWSYSARIIRVRHVFSFQFTCEMMHLTLSIESTYLSM